ncbi:hypothetical protein [Paenarthrobacter sp. C1]|uniref:hypothetical protein n=1 Tax=Paenarthrobacter sp. C1 TaxID=3400220 RepID=UPI003BF61973
MLVRAMTVVLEPQTGAAGDPLAGLRQFGGWVLVSGIVLVVIATIAAVIIWLAGKIGQVTKAQSGALGWMGRAVIAGAILGSVGGLVIFGSGIGGTNLMPSAAQPPVVDVTKNPAKSTCTSEVTHTAEKPDEDAAVITALLDEQNAKSINAAGFTTVRWTPKGPDCTSGNTKPDPCKKVTVSQLVTAGSVTRPVPSSFDPSNKSECVK